MHKLNFKNETRFLCVFRTIDNIFITYFGPCFFSFFLTINSNSYVFRTLSIQREANSNLTCKNAAVISAAPTITII